MHEHVCLLCVWVCACVGVCLRTWASSPMCMCARTMTMNLIAYNEVHEIFADTKKKTITTCNHGHTDPNDPLSSSTHFWRTLTQRIEDTNKRLAALSPRTILRTNLLCVEGWCFCMRRGCMLYALVCPRMDATIDATTDSSRNARTN